MRKLSVQIDEKKKTEAALQSKVSQLETQIKYEKEKMGNILQDAKNKEKEIQSLKNKL